MNGIAGTIGTPGRRDFFYLDTDFQMKQRTWDGTEWTHDWVGLGGIFTSVPAAVATMDHKPLDVSPGDFDLHEHHHVDTTPRTHRVDVFGLGLDYAMYHKTLWGAAADDPGPWESLGGVFTSAPAAIALAGRIYVFGLGSDLSMYWRTWNGSAWSGAWEPIGGYFSSTPVIVSWAPGRFDVFARGADFSLRHRLFEGGTWAGEWQNLGGSLASAPAAVTWGQDRLDVFAIAKDDGGLIHRWWDGDIWNDWEHIAGKSVGDDVASLQRRPRRRGAQGRLDVFAVDSLGMLRHVWFGGQAWSDPEPLGSVAMRSTPMVLVTAPNQLEVIAPGRDHNMYDKTLTGPTWDPPNWQQLGDHMRLPSQYRISIDLIRADRPRSLNNDTVTGQCTLKVGNWPNAVGVPSWPLLPITQRQGDLGNTAVDEDTMHEPHGLRTRDDRAARDRRLQLHIREQQSAGSRSRRRARGAGRQDCRRGGEVCRQRSRLGGWPHRRPSRWTGRSTSRHPSRLARGLANQRTARDHCG